MKALLFDFDGTLVDSMPVFGAIMLKILDDYKISYGPDIVKAITPLGYEGTARYFSQLGSPEPIEAMMLRMHQAASEAYAHDVQAKPNVIQTLRRLNADGKDLAVLTASPHMILNPCLKRLGIYDLFSHVWSCEDFETTKADPDIYRMAACGMGYPTEEVLFLDDNLNACQTAKRAGMKVCGVQDDSSKEYAREIKTVSDYYIDDFSQLLEIS